MVLSHGSLFTRCFSRRDSHDPDEFMASALATAFAELLETSHMSGTGLIGSYYNGLNFETLVLTRTDATVDFSWGLESPDPSITIDDFSVQWTGQIEAIYSEAYTFYTLSDEGVRLWVNGELLIDNWQRHRATEDSGIITLEAGQLYDIQLEYYDMRGAATMGLSWSSTSQVKEIVPQSQLYSGEDIPPSPGSLELSALNYSVSEDDTLATVTVNRVGGSSGAVSATLSLSDDTAIAPDDYANTPIVVNFADGETVASVEIPIINDSEVEGDETLTLTLENPTDGAILGAQSTATLTIVDDDVSPPPPPPVPPNSVVFPDDLGFVNVKDYGAVGDGITNDTRAIRQAMATNKNLYFPDGTYLITRSLNWGNQTRRGLVLQGESQDGTILKLVDNARGFSNPNQPVPFISFFEGASTGVAFGNQVSDLTIDVGSGNSGAIGLSFINNNQGGIENVTIRSSDPNYAGYAGLNLSRPWPGPGLVQNVTVTGFEFGVRVRQPEYGMVFDNLTLENQQVVGISNIGNVLSINGLTSTNTVPVIDSREAPASTIVLINADLNGGGAAEPAIQMLEGTLYARNITTSGYSLAIADGTTSVPGGVIPEYVSNSTSSGEVYTLVPGSETSLHLPIEATPTIQYDDLSQWVSVTEFGAIPDDGLDDTQAIQLALDSGFSTIYLPTGAYNVSDTLIIGDTVKMLTGAGYSTEITVDNPLRTQNLPVFRFEGETQEVTLIENLRGTQGIGGDYYWIEHASSQTLVLRHFTAAATDAYRNTGTGNLFLDDVVGSGWVFNNQSVWARQLNAEGSETKIINNGGNLWILGLKTEREGTVVETTGGGQTEILGALIYPANGGNLIPADQPAFINNESSLTLVGVGESRYNVGSYSILVEEIRDGVTYQLLNDEVLRRGEGFLIPLYTGSNENVDVLVGDSGANVLDGGAGGDTLTGGGGSDTFVYHSLTDGGDTITDFGTDDVLQISASGLGGGLAAGVALSEGASATGTFVSGSSPSPIGNNPHVLYDTSTGTVRFDIDGTGPGAVMAIAYLTGAPALSAGQILVVA